MLFVIPWGTHWITLGWDAARVAAQVEIYAAWVAAERDFQAQADDQSADAAPLLAPEARRVAADGALE